MIVLEIVFVRCAMFDGFVRIAPTGRRRDSADIRSKSIQSSDWMTTEALMKEAVLNPNSTLRTHRANRNASHEHGMSDVNAAVQHDTMGDVEPCPY